MPGHDNNNIRFQTISSISSSSQHSSIAISCRLSFDLDSLLVHLYNKNIGEKKFFRHAELYGQAHKTSVVVLYCFLGLMDKLSGSSSKRLI